jgi:predicted nucleic acid-binding protein
VKILLDTSVLVAAMAGFHAEHARTLPWLQRLKQGPDIGVVSTHTLAELYAILTRLPIRPRMTPTLVRQLIRDNILGVFEIVSLTEHDYEAVIDHMTAMGLMGGTTYDALILHAATKAHVDQVVTLNERHFRRVRPDLAAKIVAP